MKLFVSKIVLFVLLASSLNILFQYLFLKDREPKQFEIKELLKEQHDYILFGSSINEHHQDWWEDKRSIDNLIDSLVPEINLTAITRNSSSIENYYNYLDYLLKQGNKPKLLIVPINLGAYSPEWQKRPEYNAMNEKEWIFLNYGTLGYIFRKIVPGFNNRINQFSHEEFYNEPIIVDSDTIGRVVDFLLLKEKSVDNMFNHYSKAFTLKYATDIDQAERRVNFIRKFDSLSRSNKIDVIYYLTPIDYQSGIKYTDADFKGKVAKKTSYLKSQVKPRTNVQFEDYSISLDSTFFQYDLLPNEHMYQKGKLFLATELAGKIKATLK